MLTLSSITWLDICLAGVATYLAKRVFTKRNPAPYPPGPPGWPLLGNISNIPKIKPWLTFAEWDEKYGDISHIEVLGRHIIVVNSSKTALDMLDKKGSIYSDRPTFFMGGELVGWKDSLTLQQYGDGFRQHRRILRGIVGSDTSMKAYNIDLIVEIETRRFLKRVLERPEHLMDHIRHFIAAIMLRISYGYEVKENNDPLVELAERGLAIFSKSTAPGAWMVDIIPSLAKVPEWFPGASFKRIAREWNEILAEMVSAPFQFAKGQIAAGVALKSLSSTLLEGCTVSAEEEHMAMWSAATMHAAGSDTTVSSIYSLFLAMTLFPDVQKKAQAEIDVVIGDRLPSLTDRNSLPYTEALVKEVFRWHPVAPTGAPHRASEDDIHDGYYIPKGSLIIPNVWFMLNDPKTYPNPSDFNPERFLAADGRQPQPDPSAMCFGFGRRYCPGRHLAEASIWISIAMTLAAFDITKVVENGVEITPEVDPSSGTVSYPRPFRCSIKPRSAAALTLIQQNVSY